MKISHFTLFFAYIKLQIMPRSQNAHAIVNAGFLYKLNNNRVDHASIVFGGLSPKFIHAARTEYYLLGKNLFTNNTLQGALRVLQSELIVESNPPEPSVEYRKKLATGLFYKVSNILLYYKYVLEKSISCSRN